MIPCCKRAFTSKTAFEIDQIFFLRKPLWSQRLFSPFFIFFLCIKPQKNDFTQLESLSVKTYGLCTYPCHMGKLLWAATSVCASLELTKQHEICVWVSWRVLVVNWWCAKCLMLLGWRLFFCTNILCQICFMDCIDWWFIYLPNEISVLFAK